MAQLRHRREELLSEALTLQRQSWRWLPVDIDKSVQKEHRIFGRIEVWQPSDPQAPKNLDIAFHIMDDDGFVDWLDRRARQNASLIRPPNPLYTTGRVKATEWNFETPRSGRYWLAWDNRYSALTPKTVDIEAIEEWGEMMPEGVTTDVVSTSPPASALHP